MDTDTKLARAKTWLLRKHPFWGSLALSLKFVITDRIPTAATDSVHIFYNPKFVDDCTEEELRGLIAHEVCHVALSHSLRMSDRHCRKWNHACDYAINETLKHDGFHLPQDGLFNEEYFEMHSEAIYNHLPGDDEKKPLKQLAQEMKADPDIPKDMEKGVEELQDLMDQLGQEGTEMSSNDALYGPEEEHIISPKNPDGSDMSEDQLKELGINTDRMLKIAAETARQVGRLPSGMKDLIDELLEPKICWRDKFRRHVQGDNPEDYSFRRPNRRMLQATGIYMPTIHKTGVKPIVIGVDTSGSISKEELQVYLSEINSIWDDCCPESLTIIEIDTEIHDVKVFEPGDDVSSYEFSGRGGTDMEPFFDWVNENTEPDTSIVLFSDMCFYWDNLVEPDNPVLFISSGIREHHWGELVKVV